MAITLPHSIDPNTLADADEVQENFEELATKATDKTGDTLTGTLNTRSLVPTADSTYDLGSSTNRWANLYVDSITGPGATNSFSTISVSGEDDVEADSSADTLTLAAGTGITITTNATTDTITIAQSSDESTEAGSSDVTYKASGVLYEKHSSTGNVGAGEDTLWSQTVAANVLTTDGDSLAFRLIGALASNSNSKTIKVKWGATTIFTSGALSISSATSWVVHGTITRTSSTTQRTDAILHYDQGSGMDINVTTAGETLSSSSAFVVTGEATSNNDIVLHAAAIVYNPTSGN